MRHQPKVGVLATALVAGLLMAPAAREASADERLQLTFAGGRVSLAAKGVPTATILAEWARLGGTAIEGAVPTEAVTLELIDVPEREALSVLLRTAGGYVAIPRSVASGDDASRFERVVIMTSRAPVATPPPARADLPPPAAIQPPFPAPFHPPFAPPGAQRLLDANGVPVPDDQDDAPPPGFVAAPPGFSRGDTDAGPAPAAPMTPPQQESKPAVGAPAPGMIVPAPPQSRAPQR